MLRYKIDIIKALKDAGYNTNRLRQEGKISESALTKIRRGEIVGGGILGRICDLLECQPGDILENIPDNVE